MVVFSKSLAVTSLLLCLGKSETDETTTLPNSCINLEDGLHWLKLLDDTDDKEYPPIQILCSNGHAILDYTQDNNIFEYFSSSNYWHYAVVGPEPNDRVNWREWYLPFNEESTKFAISPDCNSCNIDEEYQIYTSDTTYWMTGNTFQCWWSVKGVGECEMDYFTYECYECESWMDNEVTSNKEAISDYTTDGKVWRMCGECVHAIKPSFSLTPKNHDECQAYSFEGVFQPSIGVDGRYCVCTQEYAIKYYDISNTKLSNYQKKFDNINNDNNEPELTSENNIIELYQSNFNDGTYRIKNPGYYKIMENIEFDFSNGGNINDPTKGWLPLESQINEYPGAGQYRDNYFLGFFAGITIESNDVILDLNGFELSQSKSFYYNQRWFSTIELASAMFLPGQGNGFFGHEFNVAKDITIKNGILGLSSHFGIHGNNNKNINIENIQIRNFETHGIHMNWFDEVNINNVEIGPATKIAYLKPEYGEARMLLPRIRKLADEFPDEEMQFYGRNEKVTASDVADELEIQLEYAFWYAMNMHDKIDFDSLSWESARKLFINNEGMTATSGIHGIFLNTIANPVLFTYRLDTEEYSSNVNIENVKIHGITHSMDEWIRFHHFGEEIWWNAFMGPIDARSAIDNLNNLDTPKYKGDIVIDSYIVLNYLGYNDWNMLGRQALGDGTLVNWALGTDNDISSDNNLAYELNMDNILIGCNSDAQLHSGKGILGLRIDSVENVNIKNVEIYELEDSTPLGLDECGAYEKFSVFDDGSHRGGGHFVQRPPMQTGFSGNMVQGISIASSKNVLIEDVHVHDLISHTGLTFGVSIWPGNDNVQLGGEILTEYLLAGFEVDTHSLGLGYNTRPNSAPEACGTRVVYEYSKSNSDTVYETTLTINDNANIKTRCATGSVGCEGDLSNYAGLGEQERGLTAQCRTPISAIDLLNNELNSNSEKIIMSDKAKGNAEYESHSWQRSISTQELMSFIPEDQDVQIDREYNDNIRDMEKIENENDILNKELLVSDKEHLDLNHRDGLTNKNDKDKDNDTEKDEYVKNNNTILTPQIKFGLICLSLFFIAIFGIYYFQCYGNNKKNKNKSGKVNVDPAYEQLKPIGNGNYGSL